MRYWAFDPFKDFETIRREVDRVFNDFGGRGRETGAYPLINVSQNEEAVIVEALIPGVKAETLDITVVGNQMTIGGEKPIFAGEDQPKSVHRNERGGGRFVRSFDLPTPVDENKVKADYRDGVLTVTLPKAEVAKPRKVAVNVA